jgi:RNA polymerase sigma-70 factor (ECF subfamily)
LEKGKKALNMQGLTDEELMLKFQKGETQAMDELLQRYRNPVFRFLLRLSQNDSEAKDLTQEVFLKVHQHRESYAPCGKFSSWIFSIAHNLYVSCLRKKKWLIPWPRSKDKPDELMDIESHGPSPREVVCDNEFSHIVKQCIQGLPFLQKEALILREYEHLDYEEIAKILHKSPGTIKTLIYRARQNLKIKLLPYLEEFKGGSQ